MPETSNFARGSQFYIYSKIEGEFAKDILAPFDQFILDHQSDEKKPGITIWIQSDGGEYWMALELIHRMERAKALGFSIATIVPIRAASCAVLIAIAGSVRLAGRNANYLMHNLRTECVTVGPLEIERFAEYQRFSSDGFYSLFAKYTKLLDTEELFKPGDYFVLGVGKLIEAGMVDGEFGG